MSTSTTIERAITNALKKNIALVVQLVLGMAVVLATTANAQSKPLEEIVVTTQKRAESVQDVPIAINAYSGASLERSGVENTLDLQVIEPSLVFTTNAAFGQPYLRGVGTDLFTPGAESSIATFVDDVYQSRTASSIQDFLDVERVEVVKGPQGVLFGRNAVGGAINIYTNRPQAEVGGKVAFTLGNFNKQRVEGVFNTPVVDDTLLLRAAFLHSERDGYTKNVFNGSEIDDEDLFSGRVHLLYQPSDDFDILLSANYSREDSSRNVANRVDTSEGAAIADSFGAVRPDDVFEVSINEEPKVDLIARGFSAEANWNLDGLFLKSISSYRETDLSLLLDLDSSQLDFASNAPVQTSETYTQEFQVGSSNDSNLSWVGGVYYLNEEASQQLNVALDFPAVTGAPSDFLDSPGGTVKTESIGVFLNGKYQLADDLALSAGIRYNYDKRELDFLETLRVLSTGALIVPPGEISFQDDESYSEWTPRAVLEYTPADDLLFYASVSRGYKAGGFNTNIAQPEGFDPETLWAYELGNKATLYNGQVRLNTALFYYDYSDLQLNTIPPGSPVGTFQIVINAAEAKIKGFEADVAIAATEKLEINFGLSLLDAEFDEFSALNPNDVASGETDRSGQRMPRAPEVSLNVGAQYTWRAENGDLALRADYRYESDQFLDAFADDAVQRDSNSIFNARFSYDSDEDWKVSVWGRNLTDEEVVQSSLRVDGLFGTIQFYAPPRTYGATMEFEY